MFEKYARAVADKTERNALYRLYRIRNTVFGCFMAVCVGIVIEALCFADEMHTAQTIVFGLSLLCWIVTGILSVVLFFRFRRKFREILLRPQESGASDDVTAYRKQTVNEQRSTLWALWVLIACIVCMFVLVAVDSVKYDDDTLHAYAYAGIGIAIAGILVYFFAVLRANMQKMTQRSADGAPDTQKIDASQGRTPKYSLQDDANLQSYKYLFPTPALRERAETLRRKMNKAMFIAMAVATVASLAATIALFSPIGKLSSWRGYVTPMWLAILFVAVFFATLPYARALRAAEAEQKKTEEQTPALALHLALYRKYEKFGKGKGKTLLLSVIVSFVCALVLAIVLPARSWSAVALAPIFAGLLLHNRFLKELRRAAIPLEREIDENERRENAEDKPDASVAAHNGQEKEEEK